MIELIQADITTLDVDAIVNAANSGLAGGGGVDGAIHRAAGPELARASSRLAPCPAGHAVITPGFGLVSRFVIHAVGPVWYGGSRDEPAILRSAYESAFHLARDQPGIRSIAFPAISTGVYGYPKPLAAGIALQVMRENDDSFERIVACLFDSDNLELYRETLETLSSR